MKYFFTLFLFIAVSEILTAQTILIPYRKDTLWGYANEAGKIVVEPKYYRTDFFWRNKYSFSKKIDDKGILILGIIRNDGKILCEPKFKRILQLKDLQYNFHPKEANYSYTDFESNRQRYGFVTKYGEVFFIAGGDEYNREPAQLLDSNMNVVLDNFNEISIVKIFKDGSINLQFTKNGKVGIANTNGKIIAEPIYDRLTYFSNEDDNDVMLVAKGKTCSLIDTKAKVIIPSNYDVIKKFDNYNIDQAIFLVTQNKKSAIYDANGKKLTPFTDKEIYVFSNKINGKEILSFTYSNSTLDESSKSVDIVQESRESMVVAPVNIREDKNETNAIFERDKYFLRRVIGNKVILIIKKENKYGAIDTKDSSTIVPLNYDTIYWAFQPYDNRKYLVAAKNNNFGVLNYDNKILVPFKYKNIKVLENIVLKNTATANFIATKNNNTVGLINEDNKTLIPFNYINIEFINHYDNNDSCYNFIVKNKDGLYGLINNQNKINIPEIYKNLYKINSGNWITLIEYFYTKTKENKYGIVSSKNEIFLPLIYDTILSYTYLWDIYRRTDFFNTVHIVKQNGKYGLVTKTGFLFEPIANEPLQLMNDKISDSVYYATSTYNNVDYNLYCNKNGLLLGADKGYNFVNKNNISDFKNGVILFSDNNTNRYGVLLNNYKSKKIDIIIPKYENIVPLEFLNESRFSSRTNIKYFGLASVEQNRQYDIFSTSGIKYFEDTIAK